MGFINVGRCSARCRCGSSSRHPVTLQVKAAADGKGSRVEWATTFFPDIGVSDEQVSKIFQGIFKKALKSWHLDSSPETKLEAAMIRADELRLHPGRFGDKRQDAVAA